jgi:hypothetical protein
LSSTTRRRSTANEDGQVLVIFAFGLVALLAVAALVFDVGQDLLDRRDTQNAADAAALAGAHHLTDAGCKGVWTNAACPQAVNRAVLLAQKNGYVDGVNNVDVSVKIPPGPESAFARMPGHIEVIITTQRPSFFANIIGSPQRNVTTLGVAANIKDVSISASFLALEPHDCQAGHIGGNGVVTVGGAVQVNSDCTNGALHGSGSNIVLNAPECNVVGDFSANIRSDIMCPTFHSVTEGAPPLPDPLRSMQGPAIGAVPYPRAVQVISGGGGIPAGCPDGLLPDPPTPNSAGGTLAAPRTCQFTGNGRVYRIFPGLYPGGLSFQGQTVYMEPGLYYLAGGGFRITGNSASVVTVNAGTTTKGGGILIYNTENPVYHDQCLAGTAPAGACIGAFNIGGSGGGLLHFDPYQHAPYENLFFFQDRNVTPQPTFDANGSAKVIEMTGTIYVPKGEVKLTGSGEAITTQVISNTWKIAGNGNMNVTYDEDAFLKVSGIGLVE